MKYLWLKVTEDKYELPMVVADSLTELSEILGVSTHSISSSLLRHKKMKHKDGSAYPSPYRKVRIK